MWIIWDAIAVLVMVLFVYLGVKKGFIRSLVSVLCYIVAVVLARFLGPIIATNFYSGFFQQPIAAVVKEQLNQVIEYGVSSGADIMAQLPGWLIGVITAYYPDFSEKIFSMENGQREAILENAARQVTQALADPIIEFLSILLFLILFIILAIIIKQVAKLFTGVNRIPLVGTFNMILGGFFGAVQAVVVLIIICIALNLYASIFTLPNDFISPEVIGDSFIMGSLFKLVN